MLYRVHLVITTLVVIDTDCTGSCKSNYHMIATTTAPDNSSSTYATETYFVMQLDILTEIESILINFFNIICFNTLTLTHDIPVMLNPVKTAIMITVSMATVITFICFTYTFCCVVLSSLLSLLFQ